MIARLITHILLGTLLGIVLALSMKVLNFAPDVYQFCAFLICVAYVVLSMMTPETPEENDKSTT